MARRIRDVAPPFEFLVAERAGEVLGYAYASAYRSRAAYRYSCEVSVYVSAKAKGQGVARGLYERLFVDLKAAGFRSATAIIVLPNPASISFHEALGFEARGNLSQIGFKFGQWHDAGFWQKML